MSKSLQHKLLLGVAIAMLFATFFGIQPAAAHNLPYQAKAECTVRYYLSPVVGSGAKGDPVRPLAIDLPGYPHNTYATAWTWLYNPQARPYALVVIASTNHEPLIQNQQLGAFPDVPLDTQYFEMTPEQIEAFSTAFSRFGIDPFQMMEQSTTFRNSLRYISSWISDDPTIPTLESCPVSNGSKSKPTPATPTCTVRYYISPVTGTGTDEDPLRPQVISIPDYPKYTYATAWAGVYDERNYPYVLVAVASANHKQLMRDPRLGAFPEVPMDMMYYQMGTENQAMFEDVFTRFGLDLSRLTWDATYHDILTYIVTVIEPDYPVEIGDFVPYTECP